MKLLVQGDDYGFTKGVALGILEAAEEGVLTCTGLFANMPTAPWAVERLGEKARSGLCLGIDFNLVSGPPVSDPRRVPSLVDETGMFIRSGVRTRDPRYQTEEGRRAMFPYDQVYRELRAQLERFVALTGRRPEYLHDHSLVHEHYSEAIAQLSREEGIPYSREVLKRYGFASLSDVGEKKPRAKTFDPGEQLARRPLEDFLAHSEYFLSREYVWLGGHPGYLDGALLEWSTLSLGRVRDLEMMTAPALKEWIARNGVELISYRDLD